MLDKILRTLKAKGKAYEGETAEKSSQKTNKKTIEKTIDKIREKTKEKSSSRIMSVMKAMPDVTTAELANATGLSIAAINWNIRKLKDANLIRRVGPDKGGHWEVV